ncbi:MAG: hypothetical protein U0359_21805 [Byssovorax sp.]
MRLGILGPANGDLLGLARAAQFLVDEAGAEKVVYVAGDGALERVVIGWAREIVGTNPSEEALFIRAAARCARGSPEEIDRFVEGERARLRLKVYVSLPDERSRTIELLDGRVTLFVYDKAALDEEDISAASILVFGKSAEPLIRKVGARIFVAPGAIGAPGGGMATLDDAGGGVKIEVLDAAGRVTAQDSLAAKETASKMRVQGGS